MEVISLSLTSNRMTQLTPQHKTHLVLSDLLCVGLDISTNPCNGNTQLKHYTLNTRYLSGNLRRNSWVTVTWAGRGTGMGGGGNTTPEHLTFSEGDV